MIAAESGNALRAGGLEIRSGALTNFFVKGRIGSP
jgi:hypothetical protein